MRLFASMETRYQPGRQNTSFKVSGLSASRARRCGGNTFKPANANDIDDPNWKDERWGSTIPEMRSKRDIYFLGVRMGSGSASHPNFCPEDIAPPGTAHSRFKTGSAYTCYLLQETGL